jgi:predicted Zn-dependent protease
MPGTAAGQDAEQACWMRRCDRSQEPLRAGSLAQVILKQGNQAKAEEVLRQASNDLADNPQGVRMLADYYVGSGQIDKAKAEFASLAQKYPKKSRMCRRDTSGFCFRSRICDRANRGACADEEEQQGS